MESAAERSARALAEHPEWENLLHGLSIITSKDRIYFVVQYPGADVRVYCAQNFDKAVELFTDSLSVYYHAKLAKVVTAHV